MPSTGSFSYVVPSWVAKWPGEVSCTGRADSEMIEMPAKMPSTASSTRFTVLGTSRSGSLDSSAMFETVSMPV